MQSSPFKFRLPLPHNPITDEMVCYDVALPNDPRILEAFEGAVYSLGIWTYWELDAAHTGIVAANVFKRLYQQLEAHKCSSVIQISGGADEGVEQLIRQNPTNPCLLETSIDGTHWCAFADLSLCTPAGAQPGSGSPQPDPGGGSQCYHASLEASNKWLLPYQVNAGDVIAISNANGSWTDGSGLWQCPNGQSYFLGACSGGTTTSGADPAPTLAHASLIAKIGSTYYNAYNTSITVPSGVSHANVEFQINDPSLSGNYGNITFDVCVTNNAISTWSHEFDFVSGSQGFTRKLVGSSGWIGDYVPGVGWKVTAPSDAGNCYGAACGIAVPSGMVLTSLYAEYTSTGALGGVCSTRMSLQTSIVDTGASFIEKFNSALATGPFGPNVFSSSGASWIMCFGSAFNTGTCTLTKLIVTGVGVDPF